VKDDDRNASSCIGGGRDFDYAHGFLSSLSGRSSYGKSGPILSDDRGDEYERKREGDGDIFSHTDSPSQAGSHHKRREYMR
jgi:hypothetical protein